MDTAAQLAAVTRGIRTETRDGADSYVQTLEQTYPSPIDDVWDAVTSPERIARWFVPVSGDLRLGGRYQLEGNAGGEVLACTPPADGSASFRVSWGMGGDPSFLTVTLTTTGDGTRLALEHVAGVDTLPSGMWEQFGPAGTGMGWDSILLGVSLHLTAPEAVPGDKLAWQLSEEGRGFLRGSADAWTAAHVASGADPHAAQAAATQTYRMYVGEVPGPEHSA